MTDIFVSYSRDDLARVLPIFDILKGMGWSVFMDERIQTDKHSDQVIETNLKAAKCVLVIWSPLFVDSLQGREEAGWGRDKIILLQISIDGAQPPIGFKQFHVQELDQWSGDPTDPDFAQIVYGVTRLAGEPPTETPTQTTDFYIERGNEHLAQEEYDKAITDYSDAIRLDPQDADAYFNRGRVYDKQGEYDKAIEDLSEAFRLNTQHPEAYNIRGVCYYNNDEYDKAIADYKEVIRLEPQNTDAYINQGFAYSQLGDTNEAIVAYRQALVIDPDHQIAREKLKALGVDV